MKKCLFGIFFLLMLMPFLQAQSIGLSPQKQTLEVQQYDEVIASITVGNGASVTEVITITLEQDYSFVEIDESSFEIDSFSQKTIEVKMTPIELGEQKVRIKFCATEKQEIEVSGLTSQACSVETITLNVVENDSLLVNMINLPIFYIGIIFSILGVVGYIKREELKKIIK